jgi:hypothetical protein
MYCTTVQIGILNRIRGSLGFAVKDNQIWGSVRAIALMAYARTHPQIWPFLTQIPKEPDSDVYVIR